MPTQIAEKHKLYRAINSMPIEKIARVMVFIKSIEEEEPPLTEEEEYGLKQAYAELAEGKGMTFYEAFKDEI